MLDQKREIRVEAVETQLKIPSNEFKGLNYETIFLIRNKR